MRKAEESLIDIQDFLNALRPIEWWIKEEMYKGNRYEITVNTEGVKIQKENDSCISSEVVSIGEFLSLGGQIGELNEKIQEFVDVISDRHQRRVSKITMNKDTMKSVNKMGYVFDGYFVYINKNSSGIYRTYQDYIWHIPIITDDSLRDGEVILDW